MATDRYTKIVLNAIALSLIAIAYRSLINPPQTIAGPISKGAAACARILISGVLRVDRKRISLFPIGPSFRYQSRICRILAKLETCSPLKSWDDFEGLSN